MNLIESEIKTITREHDTMMKSRGALERQLVAMGVSKALLTSDVIEMHNLIIHYENLITHERDELHWNLQKSDAANDKERRDIELRGPYVVNNPFSD